MKLEEILLNVPERLAEELETELSNLESRFARHDWAPLELNGGRFAEAVFRYLEWKESGGRFTPIGRQLDRHGIVHRVQNNPAVPEGLRFHVLRCAELLLDIRNRRDVGHLGADIDVSEMDSRLVLRLVSWVMAEIVREETQLPSDEAQAIIDRLSSREMSMVEIVDGDLLVTATQFEAIERALIALYHSFPNPVNINTLRESVRYANKTRFNKLLEKKASEALIHIKGENIFLTGKGAAFVDENIRLSS